MCGIHSSHHISEFATQYPISSSLISFVDRPFHVLTPPSCLIIFYACGKERGNCDWCSWGPQGRNYGRSEPVLLFISSSFFPGEFVSSWFFLLGQWSCPASLLGTLLICLHPSVPAAGHACFFTVSEFCKLFAFRAVLLVWVDMSLVVQSPCSTSLLFLPLVIELLLRRCLPRQTITAPD